MQAGQTSHPNGNRQPAEWVRAAMQSPGSVLLKTARADAENHTSYLFIDPLRIVLADEPAEFPAVFEALEEALRAGFYVAGFLSYEAGYCFEPAALRPEMRMPGSDVPLAWFGVYRERLETEEPFGDASLEKDGEPGLVEASPDTSQAEYRDKVERLREYIAAGDLYQANFTIGLGGRCEEEAGRLFTRLLRNQPVAYGALINTGQMQIVSASPELFFRRSGDAIVVRPMKGTATRGRDLREDREQAAWLAADAKNRAENVMILDLLRNDLGRICQAGTIEVSGMFAVEKHPTLFQMTSTVRGELRRDATYIEIFRSLFPCGSITGAPKIRAMQLIRALEPEPRGIGCGAIGYFAPGNEAVFSVAIRTLTLEAGEMRMRVGSGITYDSNADSEYGECLLKAKFLAAVPQKFELIETLRWEGGFLLLEEHLARLADSAEYFGFRCEAGGIREELLSAAEGFERGGCRRVRLLLAESGTANISSEPLTLSTAPARLMMWDEPIDSRDPFFRHKTTRRGLYDRALGEARAAGFDDALFVNERGEVTEGAIHNVMIEREGRLLTPALDCGVLPGVYRQHLLRTLPNMTEAVVRVEDVVRAERVLVFNSVRGLRAVEKVPPLWNG